MVCVAVNEEIDMRLQRQLPHVNLIPVLCPGIQNTDKKWIGFFKDVVEGFCILGSFSVRVHNTLHSHTEVFNAFDIVDGVPYGLELTTTLLTQLIQNLSFLEWFVLINGRNGLDFE